MGFEAKFGDLEIEDNKVIEEGKWVSTKESHCQQKAKTLQIFRRG